MSGPRGTAGSRPAGARRLVVLTLAALLAGMVLVGCGFDVESPDLFLLTRTGQGATLTLLVNDSGTVRCDGGKERQISSALLIEARDLAEDLYQDSKQKLTFARRAGTIYYYRMRLEHGTVSFPDLAARGRKALSEATLFAAQAAQSPCGLGG